MQCFPTLLGRCHPCALVALAPLATAVPTQAESPASDWRQTVFLYGMVPMIDGDAQVGPM